MTVSDNAQNTDNERKKLSKKKKIQLAAAITLTALVLIAMPVLAWFASRKQTATVININAPTTINIESGNREPVEMINLADIDVEEIDDQGTLVSEGDYVFCVTGKYLQKYDLQIARTTNIPFTYELYRVGGTDGSNDYTGMVLAGITTEPTVGSGYSVASYRSVMDNMTYYYPYKTAAVNNSDTSASDYRKYGKITGSLGSDEGYLNPTTSDGETIGDGSTTADGKTFHERNYSITGGTYDDVNKYAEPLYWQARKLPISGQITDGGFVDYYVLKIKWDNTFKNNKETDMIYITARKSVE